MAKKKAQADKKILDLITLAKNKKEGIAKAEKPNWKTNCSFTFDLNHVRGEMGSRINLQVVQETAVLVRILAFLIDMKAAFETAATILGSKEEFSWQGFSFSDWESDIKTRAFKIRIKKEKEDLDLIEQRLSKLISPELRAEIELEELTSMLEA